MTYAPGIEQPGSTPDPQFRSDPSKPQGLKSAPHIANPNYPHLGFNPVPGSTETVRTLHTKLANCAKTLEETHSLVTKLMEGSYWKGDAAVAFREQLDGGPLPLNLKNAAHSIRKAAKQLDRWESELDDFQRRAKRLEEDAKHAQAAVDTAKGRAAKAKDDPDLAKKGTRHDDAQKTLTHANTAVDHAQSELDKIITKARKLAEEHEHQAECRARKIRDATKKLVPHEPGWFDSALDWLQENLPDILSFLAGVIALVAIIFAGPLGIAMVAALMLTASALSAGALTLRLLFDPEMRASLWDGFTKGELDTDFWSNLVTVGGDVLGVLPGLGAVGKGSMAALRSAGTAGEVVTIGQRMTSIGASTMEQARAISSLDNSLLTFTIRGAQAERAIKSVEVTSGAIGVGTAGFGLVNSLMDADDDGIKDSAVAGIDGARMGIDGGAVFGLVQHLRS
ncbi:putative T7SS-secreted protein [Streptomyces sp. SAS_270]|uniref:putative T7SS-secreted protein n=1 Tax=Streptomyces sp. SAS_270 TaxID=3412748 RepID=UPI00403D1EE0